MGVIPEQFLSFRRGPAACALGTYSSGSPPAPYQTMKQPVRMPTMMHLLKLSSVLGDNPKIKLRMKHSRCLACFKLHRYDVSPAVPLFGSLLRSLPALNNSSIADSGHKGVKILWGPAILFWQFIVGGRTVEECECHVQFFSNPVATFGTGIASFYLPVITMTILYVHISRASKSRIKKDKKETESNKGTISPSPVRGKTMKPNNNISSAPEGLQNVKVQNGKAAGEVMTDHCGQVEEKVVSNPSTSLSVVPSIQKEEGKMDESTNVSTTQRHFSNGSSSIKVITKSQKSDYCATTVEVVSENSTKNGKARELTAAHNIIKMTKTPAEKKKGAVTRENKVTRTILAILLACIITWTPYSVMVLINTLCSVCVPNTLWTIGYWLCYINSTLNPACYALCNATFKKTFKHLLFCQYKNIGATR
ncbi:muscarinic acetylcholine receptor M2-like [Hypanus sabinus]|uniref:muscarinic acetylcholine receptor M2-like n=1 Tax=Hypanus sabinus TaxID=79690 RepID=UPI0028C47582|nr:muscarinic acetylcholine receptor M2-like [Hypanus sabinus]